MQIPEGVKQIADGYTRRVPMWFDFFWQVVTDIPNYQQKPAARRGSLAHELQKFLGHATEEEMEQFSRLCDELASNDALSEDDLAIVAEIKLFVEENADKSSDELEAISMRAMEDEIAGDDDLYGIMSRMLGPTGNERIHELRGEQRG